MTTCAYRLQIVVTIHLMSSPLAARALCLAYDVIHLGGRRDSPGLRAHLAQPMISAQYPRPELAPGGAVSTLCIGAAGVVGRPSARVSLVSVAVAMGRTGQRGTPAMQTWTVGALGHTGSPDRWLSQAHDPSEVARRSRQVAEPARSTCLDTCLDLHINACNVILATSRAMEALSLVD